MQKNKKTIIERLKDWARRLKRDLNALRIALAENLVPWYVKVIIIVTVAYALSPVDLIPDFIPVIGLLDDLIILPLLILLAVKLIPAEVMQRCREAAGTRPLPGKKSWIAAALIILCWLALAVWLVVTVLK